MNGAGMRTEPTSRGFTLMELLVAMSIFTLLGFGATAFLLLGLKSWRMAESRRDAAERAEMIFSILSEDLGCLYTDARKAPGRAILFSDYDKAGRQRLHLTRTVPRPGADPRIAESGRSILATDTIDGVGDRASLERNLLRPPGDLMSVAYVLAPEERLSRVFRTPEAPYGAVKGLAGGSGAQLIAEGVMHIEYNFWSQRTTAWLPGGEKTVGPSYYWDSTRGLGKEEAAPDASRTRVVFRGKGSLASSQDDIFPRLIEVRIVLSPPHTRGFTFLTDDLDEASTAIPVEWVGNYPDAAGENFVKIDDEWISYTRISPDGTGFVGVKRGRRNTRPKLHKADALVRYGIGFRMVMRPPCQIESWEVKK